MPSNEPFLSKPGLYERIISNEIESALELASSSLEASRQHIEKGDSHVAITNHLSNVILASLSTVRGENAIRKQQEIANSIIEHLETEFGDLVAGEKIANSVEQLLALREIPVSDKATFRPETPLAYSTLITGSPADPSLGSQLRKEAVSCDRIDILCSFIRWSGLRLLMDELRRIGEDSNGKTKIRVITTSYMGATDPKAIDALLSIPNIEVKVSYDTKRTRLHAKAYLFYRDTGFGCAYIGSANLSNAALSDGLEWTTKVSQYELPHLWTKVKSTFESYWYDEDFKECNLANVSEFRSAIKHERDSTAADTVEMISFDLRPFPYQQEILDVIEDEREVKKKFRHLVVAATGTGKTMIAAFDYRRFATEVGNHPNLLFLAHREEILQQALQSYRAVLRDHNFGELSVGKHKATNFDHLFCSIQSFDSRKLHALGESKWDYVVVDEFHHAAAKTYQQLLENLCPKILLGLTATPERADGQDIFTWFGGEASAQIRLPDAINRRLLSPFQYFGVSDSDNASLEGITWQRGGYQVSDLERIYNGNDIRAQLIVDKINEYLAEPNSARALVFCVSVAHANFMANFLRQRGLKAVAISSETSDTDRRDVRQKLVNREINFICVVDLYNEGIDIREIDTVLFLRPTESLTIFLQQLGRGLRLHPEKECLTVLDFIGSHRKEFRFAERFRALSDKPTRRADDEVEDEFPNLPSGCFIKLEKVAQERVLANIRANTVRNRTKLLTELKYLANHLQRIPQLADAINFFPDMELDDILRKGLWSSLLHDANLQTEFTAPDKQVLKNGSRRIALVNDGDLIKYWREYCLNLRLDVNDRRLHMFHISLWGTTSTGWSLEECHQRFLQNPSAIDDVVQILEFRSRKASITHGQWKTGIPLQIHAEYSRGEILAALGHWTTENRVRSTEGVLHLAGQKVDAFFVDLHKTEKY
ncbi:MAG: DEAD/DEAH box helicase family protein, partial [Pirellulales bacterium]